MKLIITMNNEDMYTINTDPNDFNNIIEAIGSKFNGFLNLGGLALNIRNISSIELKEVSKNEEI